MEFDIQSSWYKPSGRRSQRQLAWMHALLTLLQLRLEHGPKLLRDVIELIERSESRICDGCHVVTVYVDGVCQKCVSESKSSSWEM